MEDKEVMPYILEMVTRVLMYHGVRPGCLGWYELLNCGAAAALSMKNGKAPSPNRIVMDFAMAAGTTQLNAWQRMRRALQGAGWDVTVAEAISDLGNVGWVLR